MKSSLEPGPGATGPDEGSAGGHQKTVVEDAWGRIQVAAQGTGVVGLINQRLYPSRALHGQVAHEIGRRIVSGTIGEGEFLPRETELAAQFSISRQAVREALKVLAAKGLVVSRRRAGTRVLPRTNWNLLDPDIVAWHPARDLPLDFFSDLIELRRLIEPAAAEFAARRGDPGRIAVLSEAFRKMERGVAERNAYHAADVEFHRALFDASGNGLIERLSNVVNPLLQVGFRIQEETYPQLDRSLTQHRELLDAITRGEPIEARRAMEDILDVAALALNDFVKSR